MTSPEQVKKFLALQDGIFICKKYTILGTDAVLWHGKSNGNLFVGPGFWAAMSSFAVVSSPFFVQVRLFVLMLLYNCFLYELLMHEVRIFEKFARRLPADSTENCKLSKRLEFYVQLGCVPRLRVPALNVQNLNSWHLEVQV